LILVMIFTDFERDYWGYYSNGIFGWLLTLLIVADIVMLIWSGILLLTEDINKKNHET